MTTYPGLSIRLEATVAIPYPITKENSSYYVWKIRWYIFGDIHSKLYDIGMYWKFMKGERGTMNSKSGFFMCQGLSVFCLTTFFKLKGLWSWLGCLSQSIKIWRSIVTLHGGLYIPCFRVIDKVLCNIQKLFEQVYLEQEQGSSLSIKIETLTSPNLVATIRIQ